MYSVENIATEDSYDTVSKKTMMWDVWFLIMPAIRVSLVYNTTTREESGCVLS